MIIFRRTMTNGRSQVRLTRYGVVTEYMRPKVGGGYFIETSVTVPWRTKGMW